MPAVGQLELALKGHGFSRAGAAAESVAALAAEGMWLPNWPSAGHAGLQAAGRPI